MIWAVVTGTVTVLEPDMFDAVSQVCDPVKIHDSNSCKCICGFRSSCQETHI